MTLDEYDKKINSYIKQLSSLYGDEWEKLYEEISQFQKDYMKSVLIEYEKEVNCKAKECIYNLLQYAIEWSESGNSIVNVDSKEIADEVEEIIWEEIGVYLLECEIYKEDNHWSIDCMFAGNYVPYWDGWKDE